MIEATGLSNEHDVTGAVQFGSLLRSTQDIGLRALLEIHDVLDADGFNVVAFDVRVVAGSNPVVVDLAVASDAAAIPSFFRVNLKSKEAANVTRAPGAAQYPALPRTPVVEARVHRPRISTAIAEGLNLVLVPMGTSYGTFAVHLERDVALASTTWDVDLADTGHCLNLKWASKTAPGKVSITQSSPSVCW